MARLALVMTAPPVIREHGKGGKQPFAKRCENIRLPAAVRSAEERGTGDWSFIILITIKNSVLEMWQDECHGGECLQR